MIVTMLGSSAAKRYQKRVMGIPDLLAFWPLSDGDATARDVGPNKLNGTYSGTIASRRNAWRGGLAPSFTAGAVDLVGSSFNAMFNRAEFTINAFIAPTAWVSADTQRVCYFYVDASNYISVYVSSGGNLYFRYMAGGTDKLVNIIPAVWPTTYWPMITCSVSKSNNRLRLYVDGCLAASTTGPGDFSASAFGAHSCCLAAAGDVTYGNPWVGQFGNVAIYNRELTAAEILGLLVAQKPILSIIGDSIETWSRTAWYEGFALARGYRIINHAVSGNNINTHMQGQCDAAVNDAAQVILIALGTNDNSDVDSTITVYADAVATLQAAMPAARIYGMQILNKTDETYRANNNARIAAACTQKGITTINVDGWITAPGDLADGLHPNNTGAAKIYTQLLGVIIY